MEWAVHIRAPEDLNRPWTQWESSQKLRPWLEPLWSRLGEIVPSRFSFGTEFCENLLPSPDALRDLRRALSGRDFTLLTPYAGNAGLARIRALLNELPPGDEVLFSDWGVLSILRRDFPHLIPVQGRLLNKSLRDPRIMGQYADAGPAHPSLVVLQQSNLSAPSYLGLLEQFGVQRVELDHLPQGTDTAFARQGIKVSVALPYGVISTSRVCQAAGLGYRPPDKFQPAAPCRHECQPPLLEYTYTTSPFANQDQRFWLKGNTYFYLHPPAALDTLLALVARGDVDRLSLAPRIPMVI